MRDQRSVDPADESAFSIFDSADHRTTVEPTINDETV